MTRHLTRLAASPTAPRGRIVLGWVVAAVVIIGLDGAFKGDYNANYDTPGSEYKAASDIAKRLFGSCSGQEIYVVWRPVGRHRVRGPPRLDTSSARARRSTTSRPTRRPGVARREHRHQHPAHDGPRLALHQGPAQGSVEAAEDDDDNGVEIELGATRSTSPAPVQPRGHRFLAQPSFSHRLRLGGRGAPAHHHAPRPRHHLGRPDRPARRRHRRPRLDDRHVRPHRARRGHRLLAARAHASAGPGRRRGPPRRRARGRHHARTQRHHRRLDRRGRRARLFLRGLYYMFVVAFSAALRCWW